MTLEIHATRISLGGTNYEYLEPNAVSILKALNGLETNTALHLLDWCQQRILSNKIDANEDLLAVVRG